MIQIPTYDQQTHSWGESTFTSSEEWISFVKTLFKEPGKYEFDETSFAFNEQARIFNSKRIYCTAPFRSKDYVNYWDGEKNKILNGALFTNKDKNWYIPGDYYMWLNFLPIFNKEVNRFTFADVRDAQYHIALYEELAWLHSKHGALLKKRQIASSYFHAAKLIRKYWFFEGSISKMAASLKDYINEKGTWRFLDEYKNFLNTHTAWYRPSNPDKILNWEQKVEVNSGGKKVDKGLKSVILGYVLDKSPTNGVGGPCSLFYHEESGIAPRMNETIEYLLPSLRSGMVYTGQFIAAGSVGDLDQCEPLKELIYHPQSKDIYAVETNLLNADGEIGMAGLFIPEQWSMLPYIDEFGNSKVEEALKAIMIERIQWKKDLKPEDYQLRISQKPTNIEEAFAYRKVSIFPQALISQQMKRIQDKEYNLEYVDMKKDETGKIRIIPSRRVPISEFPLSSATVDKESVIVIHERPITEKPEWGTYYASIDPVGEGKSTTSHSLCSIYIYKNQIEKTLVKADGSKETYVEHGKLVAWWCGRFDDINKTHERLLFMIECYNAWTVIENNVSLFIQYMISKHMQKYLVPKDQMLFLKEIAANKNVFQAYGWKNVGTLFKQSMLPYGIEYLSQVIESENDEEGTITKIVHGITRIPDIMLLEEMKAYKDGLNVDRIIAFIALIAFITIQDASTGIQKVIHHETKLDTSQKISKLNMSPFRNIGGSGHRLSGSSGRKRSPFKNIR